MHRIVQDFWRIELMYEGMSEKYAGQPPHIRARLLRYDGYPDDKPPSEHAKETFRRLWQDREEFLRPHEIEGIKRAMDRNASYRQVVKRHEWMARMKLIRLGDE